VVTHSRNPDATLSKDYDRWAERVRDYVRTVMGLDPELIDSQLLRDGFEIGDTPAEFCAGAIVVDDDVSILVGE
jgi:hypothetical protein